MISGQKRSLFAAVSASKRHMAWMEAAHKYSSFGGNAALFDSQADQYLQFRPSYPPEAAAAIAEYHAGKQAAWQVAVDVAAGSGQASWCLTPFFESVIASDASAEQVANGQKRLKAAEAGQEVSPAQQARSAASWYQDAKPLNIGRDFIQRSQAAHFDSSRVSFSVGTSENLPLENCSADLTMTAQALHWFDISAFHRESHRVLKPGGTSAVLGYALSPWWDVRRRALVVSLYAGLDAPEHGTQAHDFEHINSPLHYMRHELPTAPAADTSMQEYLLAGSMVRARQYERPANHADGSAVGFTHITRKTLSLEVDMPVAGLRGYLSTWSGYNTFLKDPATQLRDPLEVLCEEVAEALGDRADDIDAVRVSWPCALLLATKE